MKDRLPPSEFYAELLHTRIRKSMQKGIGPVEELPPESEAEGMAHGFKVWATDGTVLYVTVAELKP